MVYVPREVFAGWVRRVGSIDRNIPPENVPALLSDMHIISPPAPVGEMLQCTKEAVPRGPLINHYASPVKKSHDRASARQLSKNGDDKQRRPRKMSKFYVKHDVFLGGSCNPTTWRHDIAIPLLESRGISYFNPQVSEWSPDLVEVEHNAKEKASVLFYVLDRRTRNVVGIVEAAYFAGSKRNLVPVLDMYRKHELVAGETICQSEYEELVCGLATLKDLVEHNGYLVFDHIHEAIEWTAKVLEGKPRGRCASIKNSLNNEENRIQILRDTFDAIDANKRGEIDLSDVYMAYQILTKKKSVEDLKKIISSEKKSSSDHMKIDFEKFCSMMIQLREDAESVQRTNNERFKKCCSRSLRVDYGNSVDIYVGGSCYDLEWKQDIAVPMLKKSGLKYQLNDCRKVQCSRACSKELEVMDKCKLLVFVITQNSRGLETMALASYYIGKGKQMIICLQDIKESSVVFDENVSVLAKNDYNRGRVYLKDLALRNGMTVVDNVSQAIQTAVDRCTTMRKTSR